MSAVDQIIDQVSQTSPTVRPKVQAIKREVTGFGITTTLLLGKTSEATADTIAARVVTGDSDENTSLRQLVASVIKAATHEAGIQLEMLQIQEAQAERARTRSSTLDLAKLCKEAQEAKSSFKIMANVLPPTNVVKRVVEQPAAYHDLEEFMHPRHTFDGDLETITTITGEVVQRRKSDGRKEPLRSIGQWCQCFIRYAVTLQLSAVGREAVDFGTLLSYMTHICAEFQEHPYQAVIQAEAKYRRNAAMAVASGSMSLADVFGKETYIRPRLDMEIASYLTSREHSTRWGKGFTKGKGKGAHSFGPVRAKGFSGKGKGKAQSSQPYSRSNQVSTWNSNGEASSSTTGTSAK
ncbi:hypothetical protein FOZ63_011956 [Perkinsus olseni]|uniref:Uncharacterized protein n=2 Tax=Perkinsus olseni TaxID=32597 RepID=A0A7J6S2G3_PEROL|nr:hypothetical protein FOZ63_011956 [Perkinsus olseni]